MLINSVRNTVSSKIDLRTRARQWRAFFLSVVLLTPQGLYAATESPCTTTTFDESVELKRVIDGDTLLLKNGHSVRLVGINAPELGKDGQASEPYATEAKQLLVDLLKDTKRVGLVYDKQRRDRYQRILAHAFLPDGKNLQYELIKAGAVQHIMFPPNDAFYKCYQSAERSAQSSNSGLWPLKRYRVFNADELTLRHIGFYRVKGRITDIHQRKGNYWLTLNDRFAFRIDGKDMKYFKKLGPETLRTHSIQAKGWIFPYKNGLNMRIHHPRNIIILD